MTWHAESTVPFGIPYKVAYELSGMRVHTSTPLTTTSVIRVEYPYSAIFDVAVTAIFWPTILQAIPYKIHNICIWNDTHKNVVLSSTHMQET
jgi:hypothetical protein